MSFRSYALLVFALVVSACASSAGASFGEGGQTSTRAARGNSTLIVRAELEEYSGRSAYEAVDNLRRRWVQRQRGGSITSGASFASVVVNGTPRGDIGELRSISSDAIDNMRYLSAADATTKYGTGYMGGVIEVRTIRAR
jgi:hypothetical protein